MRQQSNRQSGYVALISVLVTAAVATTSALTILDVATYRNKELASEQQAVAARELANGCAEEALQVISDTNSYTGTGTFTLGGGSCTYTVTSTGTNTRSILAVATSGNNIKKIQVYATIGTSAISITSWQEVV